MATSTAWMPWRPCRSRPAPADLTDWSSSSAAGGRLELTSLSVFRPIVSQPQVPAVGPGVQYRLPGDPPARPGDPIPFLGIVSAWLVPDPQQLAIRLSVNGQSRQDGSTSVMVIVEIDGIGTLRNQVIPA